jgi:hypothetical protein
MNFLPSAVNAALIVLVGVMLNYGPRSRRLGPISRRLLWPSAPDLAHRPVIDLSMQPFTEDLVRLSLR